MCKVLNVCLSTEIHHIFVCQTLHIQMFDKLLQVMARKTTDSIQYSKFEISKLKPPLILLLITSYLHMYTMIPAVWQKTNNKNAEGRSS